MYAIINGEHDVTVGVHCSASSATMILADCMHMLTCAYMYIAYGPYFHDIMYYILCYYTSRSAVAGLYEVT